MNVRVVHAGRMGDLIYSLWFVKQLSQQLNSPIDFHLQTNRMIKTPSQIDCTHFNSSNLLPLQSAQFIKPFLQKCQFIDQVFISDQAPSTAIRLDQWREKFINMYGGDIRDHVYNFDFFDLPREFWKPIIDVKANQKYKDKILITLSQRYLNPLIDYKQLSYFKDLFVFVGTDREFEVFNQKYFELKERFIPTNLLQVAQVMKGSIGYIANQTGFFSVAEALKVPRVLFPAEVMIQGGRQVLGPKNVLPLGGWCQTLSNNSKVLNTISHLINHSTNSVF